MTVLNFDLANFSRAIAADPESAIALEALLESQHTENACNSLCCTPQMPTARLYTCDRCTNLCTESNSRKIAGNKRACKNCFDDNYMCCDLSNEYYLDGELTITGRFLPVNLSQELSRTICDRYGRSEYDRLRIFIATQLLETYDFEKCDTCSQYFPSCSIFENNNCPDCRNNIQKEESVEAVLEEEEEEETYECWNCSDRTDEIYTVNARNSERSVCYSCFENEYKMCVLDGEHYENDEIVLSGRFTAHHITEEQRDRAMATDRYQDIRINLNTNLASDHDFYECNDCSFYFPSDAMNSYGDEFICDRCSQRNYFTCGSCDEFFHTDNYGSGGDCESCEQNDDPSSCDLIHEYSYNVLRSLEFLGKPSDKIFLGIELETTSEDGELHDNAEAISKVIDGYACLKEDSSIDHGFEIVTAPASLAVHLEKLSQLVDNQGDIDVNSSCGLHIHVSRKPLGMGCESKMLVFINHPDNLNFVEWIAGRSNSSWAQIEKKKITDINKQCGRYNAINLQNKDTVEFRIFQATFDKLELLARVEFVHALVYFCFQASQDVTKLHYSEFLTWLSSPQQKYKNLKNLLKTNSFWH